MQSEFHMFVGSDPRELEAEAICKYSLQRKSSIPVHAYSLRHKPLRQAGLFKRPWRMDSSGQWFDEVDGKPFSTEFSHTRFLVPELARRNGLKGWVGFVDCDFLWLGDVKQMLEECDPKYALMVVKHAYKPKNGVKMDGMAQTLYPKKLWSSLMLFNTEHKANGELTVGYVNRTDGGEMHQLSWLDEQDIGALHESWNFIPGHSDPYDGIDAIHYTEGGPWMEGYENCRLADKWYGEKAHYDAAHKVLPSKQVGLL